MVWHDMAAGRRPRPKKEIWNPAGLGLGYLTELQFL
jgi:hypothetical protein